MAVPKKKTSKSRRDMRRSHHFLTPVSPGECSNCGAVKRMHHACLSCGYHRGKQVLAIKQPKSKENEANA